MRHALRIAGAVVAVGLVGYAVVTLTGEPATPRAKTSKAERGGKSAVGGADAPSADTDAPVEPKRLGRKKQRINAPQPVNPANPLVGQAPAKGFEQALREFESIVDDVEDMAARGDHLPQAEWVELYRKGDAAMVELLRASSDVAEPDRKANGKLNERFRVAVMKIQPTPQTK